MSLDHLEIGAEVIEFSTTRRDTTAAGPNPAGNPLSADSGATHVQILGTYLRLADLRHQLANIIVAVPRSTAPRRVVEHSGAVRRRRARGSEPQPPLRSRRLHIVQRLHACFVLARLKIKPRPEQ